MSIFVLLGFLTPSVIFIWGCPLLTGCLWILCPTTITWDIHPFHVQHMCCECEVTWNMCVGTNRLWAVASEVYLLMFESCDKCTDCRGADVENVWCHETDPFGAMNWYSPPQDTSLGGGGKMQCCLYCTCNSPYSTQCLQAAVWMCLLSMYLIP